ncbi:MAG: hypothetical protein ACOY90_15560 [Candidatus Zhuqueibacterota bacterium]
MKFPKSLTILFLIPTLAFCSLNLFVDPLLGQSNSIETPPVIVVPGQPFSFTRTLYSSAIEFTDEDTLLWDQLDPAIQLERIKRQDASSLVITCRVLPGLSELGRKCFQIRSLPYFLITDGTLSQLKSDGLPADILAALDGLKNSLQIGERNFETLLRQGLGESATNQYRTLIFSAAAKIQSPLVKASGCIEFRAPRPEIVSVSIMTNNTRQDALQLSGASNTSADMAIEGMGFYKGAAVIFDDPAIVVTHCYLAEPGNIGRLVAHIEINKEQLPEIGPQKFRITHPFAMANYDGRLTVKGARTPVIFSFQPDELRADGSVQAITIKGMNFSRYARVSLPGLNDAAEAPVVFKDHTELQCHAPVPVTRTNTKYQMVITNPDGQSATGEIAASRRFALAQAEIRNRAERLYFGKPTTVEFVIFPEKDEQKRKFNRGSKYEVKIGNQVYEADYVNQAMLRAHIDLPSDQALSMDTDNLKLSFSLAEKNLVAEWTGEVDVFFPPVVQNPPALIFHPGERAKIVLNGNQLAKASLLSDENLTVSGISSSPNQLAVSVKVENAAPDGTYHLTLSKDGLPFEKIPITVKQWASFESYIRWGKGRLPRMRRLTFDEQQIHTHGAIQLELDGSKISRQDGKQIVTIEARFDSLNAVPFFTRSDTIVPGKPAEYLPITLSGQVTAGNILRISISNIHHQNEFSLRFRTMSLWHERVEAATGITAMRIPLNGDNVQLLEDIALGLNYRFHDQLAWAKMNVSAFIMNPTTDDGFSADIGAGVSLVLWNHLILGLGKQFTANTYSQTADDTPAAEMEKPWFLILGVAFKFDPTAVTK